MGTPMLCTPNLRFDSIKFLKSSFFLGKGGSATTFKGLHGVYGEVAAKVLTPNTYLDTSAANEIDLLSHVNANQFVVNLHGWCMMDCAGGIKRPVIVMEYMSGGSLDQLLYPDSIELPNDFKHSLDFGMDTTSVIMFRLLKELAGAIHFLHTKLPKKNPIVHCDLKPTNLLLTMEMHLKISDFGSAMRCLTTEHIPTDNNSLYVTPRYCAPELFTGNLNKRPLTQVDIYSFGIILWEILVREVPYKYAHGKDFIQHAVINHANRPTLEENYLEEKGLFAEQIKALNTVCPLAWHPTPDERPTSEKLVTLLAENFPFSHKFAFSQAHEIAKKLLPHCSDSDQNATEPLSKLIDQHMKANGSINGTTERSASVVEEEEDSTLGETIPKQILANVDLNIGATREDGARNVPTETLENDDPLYEHIWGEAKNNIPIQHNTPPDSDKNPRTLNRLYPATSCCSLSSEEDLHNSNESLLSDEAVANGEPLYVNIPLSKTVSRSSSFHGDDRGSIRPFNLTPPQKIKNTETKNPTFYLILGAKKVGKHAIINMYDRITQKKIFKNEPYNKFIVQTKKDYHQFLPRIDVVMLCFAADNKKSLDQMKAIWQDLSPTRNMVNVPVVVIMTSSGKQSSIPQANFNNADQYTDSIKGKMLSVALNNETDVQRVFDEAYKRQDLAKRRFVKLPDVPFPETP